MIGDGDTALVRVGGKAAPPETPLWLVTYPDLRRTPAVKAVMAFLVECVSREPHFSDS
jgi:hypothetical protein